MRVIMQLQDVDDVYETVGDAMLGFIGHRLAKRVFPNAMLSKEDFWSYLPWMRALVFVFLSRYHWCPQPKFRDCLILA